MQAMQLVIEANEALRDRAAHRLQAVAGAMFYEVRRSCVVVCLCVVWICLRPWLC